MPKERKRQVAIRRTTRGKGANYRPTKSGAGMTRSGVKAHRRANSGSKLKTAVTGKVKAGSKAAKRRKSYCARSLGQLKRSSAKTRNNPNSRIRQARRRWKCQVNEVLEAKVCEEIRAWSSYALEKPNSNYNDFPACPFAAKAWADRKVDIQFKHEVSPLPL